MNYLMNQPRNPEHTIITMAITVKKLDSKLQKQWQVCMKSQTQQEKYNTNEKSGKL